MAKHKKSPHPRWATDQRKPGTELRLIRGRYYLYAVSSRYDPTLKRAKKITGKILGTITEEDGFVESEKRKLVQKAARGFDPSTICVREFGFTSFLKQYNAKILERLLQYFPQHFQLIIYMAYCRLVHYSPLKNMAFHVAKTMLSIEDKTAYNEKDFSVALRQIGSGRQQVTDYLKSFVKANDYVMVDMTNVFTNSEKMRYAKEGYNSEMVFESQFNLMYIYSPELLQPVFYRLYPGNIREVKGFKTCLQESGLTDAIIIADKGFYSAANVILLDNESLKYIIPLKRDNTLIEYEKLDRKQLGYFKFEERYIWYLSYEKDGRKIFLFKDEKLRVQEEKDYLDRIETLPEYYQLETFHQKTERFGTIALLSNVEGHDEQHIFTSYKSRNSIEVMFDGIKNVLHADRTYMQNEDALQGWMFVNHIALQWYYIIYALLKNHKQLKRYSVTDFIKHLYELKKIRINDDWIQEPQIKATETLLKNLNLHIT